MSSVSLFWSRIFDSLIPTFTKRDSMPLLWRRNAKEPKQAEVAVRAPEAPQRGAGELAAHIQEVFPRAKTHEELIPANAKPCEYFYSPYDRPTISLHQCWCAKCNKQVDGMEDFAETVIGRGGVVCGNINVAARCHGAATVAVLNISKLRKLPIGTRIVLFDQIEGAGRQPAHLRQARSLCCRGAR